LCLNHFSKGVDVDWFFMFVVMGCPWVEASVLVLVLVLGSGSSFHLFLGVSGVTLMAPWVVGVLSMEVVVLGVSFSAFSNGTVVGVSVTSPRVVGLDLLLGVTSPVVGMSGMSTVSGLLVLVLPPWVVSGLMGLLPLVLNGLLVLTGMGCPWAVLVLSLFSLHLSLGVSGVTLMAPWVVLVLSVEVVVLGVLLSAFSNGTVVCVLVTSPRVVGLDLLLGVTSPWVLMLGLLMLVLILSPWVLLLLGLLLLLLGLALGLATEAWSAEVWSEVWAEAAILSTKSVPGTRSTWGILSATEWTMLLVVLSKVRNCWLSTEISPFEVSGVGSWSYKSDSESEVHHCCFLF
jgi:hypothetical protein